MRNSNMFIKKIKYIIIIYFLLNILFSSKVNASTGSMETSVNKTSLIVGETATLTVKATNSAVWYNMISSDSSIVSINTNKGEIDSDFEQSKTISYTITAKKEGKAKITVSSYSASGYDGNKFSYSKTFDITVTEPKKEETPATPSTPSTPSAPTKSSDATLKLITVGGKTYTNPNTDITAPNVSSDTSSIKISAQTNNAKASVTGTGTKELVTGTNKFTLKVTAENGATKTYIIRITRLAEEIVTPNVVEENISETEEQPLRLTSLKLFETSISPEFDSEIFEYTANVLDIDEIKVEAVANIPEAIIETTGNTEIIEGENIIIVKVIKDEDFVEYKIKVNKTVEKVIQKQEDIEETKDKTNIIGFIQNWWNGPGKTETVFISTLALFGAAVIFAVVSYKYGNKTKIATRYKKNENNY